MLSTENPPDPSCSCKVIPALVSDERAPPERLAFLEADPVGLGVTQSSHFSIRDYVFKSRSKDIGTNWPFPQQYLQLCLKHGVRDLLPPFEPPDFVRAWHSRKGIGSKELFVCSDSEGTRAAVDPVKSSCVGRLLDGESDAIKCEPHLPIDQSGVGSSDQAQNPLSEDKLTVVQEVISSDNELTHGEAEIESTVTSHDRTRSIPSPVSELPSVQETRSISESLIELEVDKPPPILFEKIESLCEPSDKKCKLIVKLSTASADIVSNSSSVSDPMASKLCPVCKTFSSTSNTTLNAHIDQCLSMEASTKRVMTKFSKHKVKPRKKRSMVDICATAPHCTLEDLDRRNGSNWALDLSLVAPTGETCITESKRPKISPVHPIEDESEGAVYVDSNGTKLRILSKFNDAPPASAAENPKPWKFRKEIKDGRSFAFGKKNHFSPKYMKYMKVRPQSKKLMSSFKPFKCKIHVPSEGKPRTDTHHEKEESLSQISISQDQIKSREPGTLRQWVCSKRSGLSKKLNNKVIHRVPRNPVAITHNLLVESNGSVSGDSVMRTPILKFSSPSDDLTSSLKTKSMNILSKTVNATDNGEKHSSSPLNFSGSVGNTSSTANGLMLKFSRSSGNYVSSPRSKRVEIHANIQKSDKFHNLRRQTSESCHSLSQKVKKNSTSRKNLLIPTEFRKCNEAEKSLISKKLQKHRSIEDTGKRGGILRSDFHDGYYDSPGNIDLGSASNNQTSGTYQSKFSENNMRPETEGIVNQVSSIPGNTLDSEQSKKDSHIIERKKCITLVRWKPGAERHHSEMTLVDSQVEVSGNVDTVTKSSLEKAVGAPVTSDTVTSKDHSAAIYAKLDSYQSLEKHIEPIGGAEASVEPTIPRLFGDLGMQCGDETNNEIVGQNIRMSSQTESIGNNNSYSELQNMESRTDTASIQGSSACLTSPGETILEVPHENSSVTSVRIILAEDQNMAINGDPSGSPVSFSTTISHLSVEDFKLKDSELESLVEPVAIVDKLRSGFSDKPTLPPMASTRGTERTNMEKKNQEVNTTVLDQEPEKFWNDQPCCCCSRKESLSQDSQLFKQSIMTGRTLPAKAKQMTSNLYIRPIMPSSFGTCSSLRTKEMAHPLSDSPTYSISMKASSDSAVSFPTCIDFGSANPSSRTQPQSTSSPILRLMGKNLMVMNKEEEPIPPEKAVPCSTTDNPNSKYLSLLRFSSTRSVSNTGSIPYHPHQSLEGSMFLGQGSSNAHQVSLPPPTMRVGGFVGTPLQNGLETKTDSHARQKRLSKKPSPPLVYNVENVSLPHQRQNPVSVIRAPTPTRELIVIDDSPEVETKSKGSLLSPASTLPPTTISGSNLRPPSFFSCFPPQNPFQLRELPNGSKPGFPISCPRASVNSTKPGSTSEASVSPLASPFIVPSLSACHLMPTPHYSPSLR